VSSLDPSSTTISSDFALDWFSWARITGNVTPRRAPSLKAGTTMDSFAGIDGHHLISISLLAS
jgi:hypothetical protein